jgi:hypothetical protein
VDSPRQRRHQPRPAVGLNPDSKAAQRAASPPWKSFAKLERIAENLQTQLTALKIEIEVLKGPS